MRLSQKENRKSLTHDQLKELFKVGHDLWRDHPTIKQFALHKRLAKIASPLFHEQTLRIAYDQALYCFSPSESIFPEPFTIQEVSCIQPICGAVFLRLSEDPAPPDIFPKKIGSTLFVRPDFPIPWSSLSQQASCFFLIVYCKAKAVYAIEKRDPHTHDLKKLGYGSGDLLEEKTHPTIFNQKA